MKKLLTAIASIAVLLTNCKNNVDQSKAQNNDQVKAAIEKILKVQEDAYAQHNEEGNKIMQSTCEDSLMYVNGGSMTISAYLYAHDLADGWIEQPHNKKFQFYTNTVIVSSIYKSYYLLGADTIFNNNRMTKVFVKDDKEWKMAGIYFSPLQINYTKERNVDAKLYSDYTGVYKVGSNPADTIILINGKLYAAQTGNERDRMFPLNDSTFICKDDLGTVVFGRDSHGKVTRYTYVFPDGQRIHVPKVK